MAVSDDDNSSMEFHDIEAVSPDLPSPETSTGNPLGAAGEVKMVEVGMAMDMEALKEDAVAGGGGRNNDDSDDSYADWKFYAMGALAMIVIAATCVAVVLILADSDEKSSVTTPVTNYFFSSALTMAGISDSQFDDATQTQFKSTIATKMSVPASYIVITDYEATGRRSGSVRVNFDVFDSSPIPQSKMTTLATFLKASDSTGFTTMLNTNLASASITHTVSAVSGVMTKTPPQISVPPLALMPSASSDPSRRSAAPTGSSLSTFTTTEETLVPGGVEKAISTPKELLCMMQHAKVTDRAVWGDRNSAPASGDNTGVELASFDAGVCFTNVPRNESTLWLMYQGWHTGNPDATGIFHIHAYIWYYNSQFNQNPTIDASQPAASIEVDFTVETSSEQGSARLGTNVLTSKPTGFDFTYDLTLNSTSSFSSYSGHVDYTGCGKGEGAISWDSVQKIPVYSSLKSYSTDTQKVHFEYNTNYDSDCTGTGSSAVCQADVEVLQQNAAVLDKSPSDLTSGMAQTVRLGTFVMPKCVGLSQADCDANENYWKATFIHEQAAVMEFNADKAALQTANTTSNLGVNQGNAVPGYCLDRNSVKTYPEEYYMFDTSTGELWTPDTKDWLALYHRNTTATDANGKAWSAFPYSWVTDADGNAIDHGARVYCHRSGSSCSVWPASSQDIDGDGVADGYFADNTIADGTTFDSSKGLWGGGPNPGQNVILKYENVLLAPTQVSASECNSLTLTPLPSNTAPDTLNCGSSANPTTATNGNRQFAVPTCPSTETYVDGVRQG